MIFLVANRFKLSPLSSVPFITYNCFMSVTNQLLWGLDFICCSPSSSLPLCVRTRLWAWLTWCECFWSIRCNSVRLNQTINCIFLVVRTVAIAMEWWRKLEANTSFLCFQRSLCACVWVCRALHACLWVYVFVWEWMCLWHKEINLFWLDIQLMIMFHWLVMKNWRHDGVF